MWFYIFKNEVNLSIIIYFYTFIYVVIHSIDVIVKFANKRVEESVIT